MTLLVQVAKIEILMHFLFLFSAPDFVNSVEDENHVYFFFRESAVEYINCGKVQFLIPYSPDKYWLEHQIELEHNKFENTQLQRHII